MKKLLIPLAALSLAGAACAQSSLTLFGIADYWAGHVKGTGASSGSGGMASSRWGLRGTEDLGGGLSADFMLEQEIDLAQGAAKGNLFNRQAYLALKGGFGEARFGNVLTPFDDLNGATNSGFDSALAATAGVWVGHNANPFKQVYYATPEWAGWGAAISGTLNGQTDTAVTSVRVNYSNGPVYAGLAHQADKQSQPGLNVKHTLLNGTYDFEVVKLLASLRHVTHPDTGADKAREYQLGLEVPLSSALTLSASYARSNDTTAGVRVAKRQGYDVAFSYGLSMRTTLYGGLQKTRENLADTQGHLVAVGINHKF